MKGKKNEGNTNKLLVKISVAKKLSEMNELKMGPVNVFLPWSVHTSHFETERQINGSKLEAFCIINGKVEEVVTVKKRT